MASNTFIPGDIIQLKRGDEWNEPLVLNGDGLPNNPITLTAYGTGNRPYIRLRREPNSTLILLQNHRGWIIRGLELGFAKQGIAIQARQSPQAIENYVVEDCYIHDIDNPSWPENGAATGISVNIQASQAVRDVRNLVIKNSIFFGNQTAFRVKYHKGTGAATPFWIRNATFTGNTILYNGFNTIHQAQGQNFDLRNNVLVYNVPWNNDFKYGNTAIIMAHLGDDEGRKNEVVNNEIGWTGEVPNSADGAGYDFEDNSRGIVFRNNLIHSSYGEGVLFMPRKKHRNLTFSDNILVRNMQYNRRSGFNAELLNSPSVEGSGVFARNIFVPRQGLKGLNAKSPGFKFDANDERSGTPIVDMPRVIRLDAELDSRVYALATRTPGASIRYTLDGSKPTLTSPLYTSPVTVQGQTAVLNAKAFKPGSIESFTNSLLADLRNSREGSAPVLWWRLNEGSGKTATDAVGNYAATLSGDPRWSSGKLNGGLQFDGKDDSVVSDQASLVSIKDEFTIAFWANPAAPRVANAVTASGISDVAGQRYAVVPIRRGGGPDSRHAGVGVSVGTNGINVIESGDGYMPTVLADDVPLCGWTHIAVVYRKKQPTLYVNGVYRRVGFASQKTVHPSARLGGDGTGWYKGTLDEVRIYDRALTNAEIDVLATSDGISENLILSERQLCPAP